MAIEFIHGIHDAVLEFLFGYPADVAQHRAGELGEEALDEIEPGAVLGREGELEAAGRLLGEPSFGLFGDVCRMIVEDQLDRRVSRISGIEELEEFDEFAAAVAVLDEGVTLPVSRSMPASKLTVPWRLYSWSRATVACLPGAGGRSGAVAAIA